MKIDPFPNTDSTMKKVSISDSSVSDASASTISDAYDLFEKSMLHLYPDCELVKTAKEDDNKGVDYISGNRKIALTNCWGSHNDTHSMYTVCSSKDSNTLHIFNSEADIFVVYSVSKKEFLIMSTKDIKRYACDKFPGIEKGLEDIYFSDSTRIVNYKDNAIENNLIHSRHRGGKQFDYFIYPERDVLIKNYNAKIVNIPAHLVTGEVHGNV